MVRVSINVPERSEPTVEGSRGSGPGRRPRFALPEGFDAIGAGVTALGVVAGVLLVVTLFMTITSVDVANGSCEVINDANHALADRCSLSGFERHGPAFALLGLVCIVMAVGAGMGGSRPAAVALIGIGLVAIVITVLTDFPESGQTGAIGQSFEGAKAAKGIGLYAELLAGALATAAGVIRLANPRE